MNLSLAALVAPLSVAEFLERLAQRRPTFLHGDRPERFQSLLSWETLRGVMATQDCPPLDWRLTVKARRLPRGFYRHDDRRLDAAKVDVVMSGGASLIATNLDRNVPALAELADAIRPLVHDSISIGAIVTTGSGGAMARHYDAQDLLLLQVEGAKRWRIYEPRATNFVRGRRLDAPTSAPDLDEVLRAGDALFLPAGCWHDCENSSSRSLHVGIFFDPLTAAQVLGALARRVDDDALHQPLLRHGESLEHAEAALKQTLIARVNELSLPELLAQHQANGGAPYSDDDLPT
jgi:bifunctional lysine-specific demethylase and histidyl-hydroxylase NO66